MKKTAILTAAALVVLSSLTPVDARGEWVKDDNGWYYDNGDGTTPYDEFVVIDGKYYYFDDFGYMVHSGWKTIDGDRYYFYASGEMARSKWIDGDKWVDYYGMMERDTWVDNGRYYVDGSGKYIASKGTKKTSWKKDAKGWWFDAGDGWYPRDLFYEIDKEIYFFDENGYMKTGWIDLDGYWFYFGNDGKLRHNQWIGDYYVGYYGYMLTDCWVDFNQYYVGSDGKWIKGYGEPHWEKDSKGWRYNRGDDTYVKGQQITIDGKQYIFNSDGYQMTGWVYVHGSDFYFYPEGGIAQNKWVGNAWADYYGRRQYDQWVDNARYYVDIYGNWDSSKGTRKTAWKKDAKGWWFDLGDGSYAKDGLYNLDKELYYFNKDGYMLTGWQKLGAEWYYFGNDGAERHNQWIGDYYVGYWGNMLKDQWIDDKYYVGSDGKWDPNKKH